MQAADCLPPWSCTKKLQAQLGIPSPHPFPDGVSPTPRGTPQKHAAAQGLRLFAPSSDRRHSPAAANPTVQDSLLGLSSLKHSTPDALARHPSLHASQHVVQAGFCSDAELEFVCQHLAEAAASRASGCSHEQEAEQAQADATSGGALNMWQSEAAAGHAEQKAALKQTLVAVAEHRASPLNTAADTEADAAFSQRQQAAHAQACPALLQAAEAGLQEDNDGNKVSLAGVSCGNSPADLTLACEQLTEAASAHASQREQLYHLLQQQQQLAMAPCTASVSAGRAKKTVPHNNRTAGRQPGKAAGPGPDKTSVVSKVLSKPKQRCSTSETAAWPPGPAQASRVVSATPPVAQKAVTGSVKQTEVSQEESSMAQAQAARADAAVHTYDYDSHVAAKLIPHPQLAPTHGAEHAVPNTAAGRGIEAAAQTDTELIAARPDSHDAALAVIDESNGATRTEHNLPGAQGHAVDKAEPSFGAVHAMLSALQLPAVDLTMTTESSPQTSLPHTCDLLLEAAPNTGYNAVTAPQQLSGRP